MEVARVWGEGAAAAAAAAKSLKSCPTLCDPIDGSPPGSPVPGILQEGAVGSYCLFEQFQFCKMKRVLEMDGGGSCIT